MCGGPIIDKDLHTWKNLLRTVMIVRALDIYLLWPCGSLATLGMATKALGTSSCKLHWTIYEQIFSSSGGCPL